MNEERQGNIANTMLAEVPVRIQRSRKHKQVSPNGLPTIGFDEKCHADLLLELANR